PSQDRPQQAHLDLDVPDLEAAHQRVLGLGAKLLDDSPETFRVYADPVGHPFCLCAC
ncbi:VOC family protein, partial [Streptomyces sp. AA4]